MKIFKCFECGNICYSSAPIESQTNPYCEKCGGKIKEVTEREIDNVKN